MLKFGEPVVWWMEVSAVGEETLARWRATLNATELARADRFRRPADRTGYVAAHALVRGLLSEVGGRQPHEWEFVVGRNGKPGVSPRQLPGLEFNLSHCAGLVTAVACLGHAVGIDVEASDRPVDLRIADHFFASSEVDGLARLPPARRSEAFFRLWTLKEAYAKATGAGLQTLDRVAFSLDPVRVYFRPSAPEDPTAWQFFEKRPTPQHVLAIALHRPGAEPATVLERAVGHHSL